jgi:AAA15 family ATPase/GTPase
MIESIYINNFKCFKNFTLDNFNRVNLISGRNNAGKTSLLESLLILYSAISPNIFNEINASRCIPIIEISTTLQWDNLFYYFDLNNIIKISVNDNFSVNIMKDAELSISSPEVKQFALFDLSNEPNGYILKIEHIYNKITKIGRYVNTVNGIVLNLPESKHHIDTQVFFIPSKLNFHPTVLANWFDKILLNDKKQSLIKFLQLFYPQIDDLFVIGHSGSPYFLCKSSLMPNLPISLIGNGLYSLLILLLCALANPNSLILVDEIENGIHYSFLPTLWKIIFEISLEYNCQFVFTTHSYECLSSAIEALKDPYHNIFSYYRFDKDNDSTKPYFYSEEILQTAIEHNFEVR